MLYLKCTSAVQKAIGLRKDQIAEAHAVSAPLGSWYAHRFLIRRVPIYLFMSEVSLLSFILYQGKKQVNVRTLPNMFMAGLTQLLVMKGIGQDQIDYALSDYRSGLFAKTDSRSLLGSMSDLVRCYDTMIEVQGGLVSCDLTQIIMKINDMPQRSLGWRSSWDVTQAVLAVDSGVFH